MVYNKYIGIIGGTGTIGSIIVKYLLQLQTHFHVLIGVLNVCWLLMLLDLHLK